MSNFTSRLGIIGELLSFLWQRKLWWLIPMVIVIIILGVLLILPAVSSILPFIYPFF